MAAKLDAYVGTDPGAKGSYCLLVPDTKQVAFLPTTTRGLIALDWFRLIQQEFNLVVNQIEDVHAIHGSAAGATFSFGRNVERVNLVPEIAECSITLVTPKTWQKHIGLKPIKTGTVGRSKMIKNNIAAICERLYPQVNIRGPKGGLLDGKSDSLMIAHYASQTFKL